MEEEEEEVPEIMEEEADIEDEEAAKRNKYFNPLKLPLGWDGRPIPFWLYKLHGLGHEYPCEICGGHIYMGRQAFDRHFLEWRHAYGLKCLGIPNSKHFRDITKIADIHAVYERFRDLEKTEDTSADAIEEFEDDRGNVFNKKTYEGISNADWV